MWKCRLTAWVLLLILQAALNPIAIAAPDEEQLGKSLGYPVGTPRTWFYDERTRVGSFSQLDSFLPHNTLKRAVTPSALPRAPTVPPIVYTFEGSKLTIDDFLASQRITGLLIIKGGKVLVERYQYDRTATHRFVSHSMAKSIVALAVGMALEERLIASLDDSAAKYEPKLNGSAYGDTTIRNLLRMASGVKFSERYDGKDDLATYSKVRNAQGTIEALRQFKERERVQGQQFQYASIETVTLAVVLQAVTRQTLSAYLSDRLWQPMGAEADATWIKSPDGLEVAAGSFNAVLRDYGRLGVLLANDGAVAGKQVLPRDFLIEATNWKRHPAAFRPAKATPYFGYGYQFWLYPGHKRRFALLGVYGQSLFVDPELKLVMVLTAVAKNASVGKERLARERDAFWRGLVATFGKW